MGLARQVSSLGLSARNSAGLKVRQPLAAVLVYAGEKRSLDDEMVEIVKDELNVKDFRFVEKATNLVTYNILPDNKLLGPKFGAQFPKVRSALQALDPLKVADSIASNLPVTIEVDGENIDIAPEEILVNSQPREGLMVASDKFITVAVDAEITPELHAEGLAREIVRRIQAMRKAAGFNIEDRIFTYYQAAGELAKVFQVWGDYIKTETLSVELIDDQPPQDFYTDRLKVEGEELVLGLKVND
jgi:isoleucyl-tRNA synthetase